MSSGALPQPSTLKESAENARPNWKLTAVWRWVLRVVAVALALIIALVNRFGMNVDGISYLDMAYAYMRGDWKIAINSYWGAGYSWIIGVFLAGLRVHMRWESTVVHLVNVLIFIIALVAFEYFLQGVIQLSKKIPVHSPDTVRFDDWMWWVVGYLLFLVVNVFVTPVNIVTPDLCVEAAVLLASGIVVRIAAGTTGILGYIALGVTLGIGYLIKSPVFPLGVIYLATAWLAAPRGHRKGSQVVLAAAIFLAISTPYVVAISRSVGRPTIGENARVTYGHYVLGVEDFSYWTGEVRGLGTPRHRTATRRLMSAPDVYEFSSSTGGTLPPYYNPPYWADGLVLHVSLAGEIRVLKQSAAELLNLLYSLRDFVVIFLVLVLLQQDARSFCRRLLACWVIWVPGLAAVAMYVPLHLELRFLGGFILLFWAALSFALEFPGSDLTARLFRASALALVFLVGYRLTHDPASLLRESVPPVQWRAAQWLQSRGLQPGDSVAEMLKHGNDFHYWAHLAGAHITAEVPANDEGEFWASTPEVQRRVEEALSKSGAKFLVTRNPSIPTGPGWEKIPDTDYVVLRLPPS